MNLELFNKIKDLEKAIKESIEYKNLQEKNALMENSEEVCLLAYKKDMLLMEYEDSLKIYKSDSMEVKKKKEALNHMVFKLNSHPVVVEYNRALNEYNKLLKEISDKLFNFLND